MKIISFRDGLGNQLFQYQLYRYLSSKFPNERVIAYYNKKHLRVHNGLEIFKYFDVLIPYTSWYVKYLVLVYKVLDCFYDCISTDLNFNENSSCFIGYWQDKSKWGEELIGFPYKNYVLSKVNQKVLEKIQNTNSVFIHVRRGDYLLPGNEIYNVCNMEYYESAISYINGKVKSPVFYFFSDDIEWAKSNFSHISNTFFIDSNKGTDSFFDMFLMSYCKYGIIANSTFSYWGAVNGVRKNIIIYPINWKLKMTGRCPNIFDKSWIGL